MPRRHVLIGSGPAAISAAQAIRGLDADADITMLSAEAEGYYSRPGLAYYLAREIPESSLFPFSPKELSALGIQRVLGVAGGVDRFAHTVTLTDGRTLTYDRLLLATGSTAVAIGAPGADLDGVVKLDDLSDARGIADRSRTAGAAVVVGGGITALEIVEGLLSRGVRVHYLMRKDRYWANVLSAAESALIEKGLAKRGVETHTFAELGRIFGEGGRVAGVETSDGTRIACGMVAVAIGVVPRKELAEGAGLECGRGVLVDEFLRSSDSDIYAAGDIAEALETGTQRRTVEVLWNSAVEKGRVAGANMAGEPVRPYIAGDPLNVTRLAGYTVTIIGSVGGGGTDSDVQGIVRGDSEAWRHSGGSTMVESQAEGTHLRLALAGGTIVGAVVMGDQRLSVPLQQLIKAKADVSSAGAELIAPNAPLDRLVDRLWQTWRTQHV